LLNDGFAIIFMGEKGECDRLNIRILVGLLSGLSQGPPGKLCSRDTDNVYSHPLSPHSPLTPVTTGDNPSSHPIGGLDRKLPQSVSP